MLIKEYRIPLPVSVEEYRIAQLYMIAKKSREESKGTESGVEILVNEPYSDGPGGSGQFTHKIYHVGSHLPGWFKSLLPKSALTVEEEAWNAYPYTKTRFKCPFVEKFSLEIETYYTDDGGHREDIFDLSDADKKNRVVDLIDVVKDQDGTAYDDPEKEDPKLYVSDKTGRGPLTDNWIDEYWSECQKARAQGSASQKSIMCAYKLCKVEFRYWGMQSKIERFIHDVALRKMMLKAHLQAWIWQDEWHGLTMEDIRAIERETAELLKRTMHGSDSDGGGTGGAGDDDGIGAAAAGAVGGIGGDVGAGGSADTTLVSSPNPDHSLGHGHPKLVEASSPFSSIEYSEKDVPNIIPKGSQVQLVLSQEQEHEQQLRQQQQQDLSQLSVVPLNRSKSVNSPPVTSQSAMISAVSLPGRSAMSRESNYRRDSESQDDDDDDLSEDDYDEFFDCRENLDDETASLAKWSSMELVAAGAEEAGGRKAEDQPENHQHKQPHQHRQDQQQQLKEPHVTFRRVQSLRESVLQHGSPDRRCYPLTATPASRLASAPLGGGPSLSSTISAASAATDDLFSCPTTVLFLVAHGGSVLDLDMEASVRKSDVNTFRGALESVMRTHYPAMVGHVAVKCVPCPAVCAEALAVLSSLSPYSFDVSPIFPADNHQEFFGVSHDHLPVGTIPLLAVSSSSAYAQAVGEFIKRANQAFSSFLSSEEGRGFFGQVVLIGDSVGAIMAFDAVCSSSSVGGSSCSTANCGADGGFGQQQQQQQQQQKRQQRASSSEGSLNAGEGRQQLDEGHPRILPTSATSLTSTSRCCSTSSTGGSQELLSERHPQHHDVWSQEDHSVLETPRLEFEVSDFFAFGSPLGFVLAFRKIQQTQFDLIRNLSSPSPPRSRHPSSSSSIPRPSVQQLYNLFHPTDPLACRVEPLLSAKFSRVPPINVPRYQKYPMGDGASLSLIEFIQANPSLFAASEANSRPTTPGRHSDNESVASSSLTCDHQMHAISVLRPKWWGCRRLDYALYCPEGLSNFPTNSLPHLFHSSYWESADVISFVLRQVVRPGMGSTMTPVTNSNAKVASSLFLGADGFAPERPREKWIKKRTSVKIRNGAANHRANDVIVKEGNSQNVVGRFAYGLLDMSALTGERVDIYVQRADTGDWHLVAMEITDRHGRVSHTLENPLPYGVHAVRMVVRGDHSMLHCHLAVVPPKTETVVFSIDGSFAASVSVTGKDPKVKAGAVDVVRHWQELGYLIVYVTGRPDMQLQKVVSWLAQHNFPHGMVSFADGLSTDPLRHKADFLRSLATEQEIIVHRAYGSAKDVSVYASALSLSPAEIYVVGRAGRRAAAAATPLSDGYAEHLARLTAHGGSRPARGNARMVLPKGSFGLPGQNYPAQDGGGSGGSGASGGSGGGGGGPTCSTSGHQPLGRRRTMRSSAAAAAKRTPSVISQEQQQVKANQDKTLVQPETESVNRLDADKAKSVVGGGDDEGVFVVGRLSIPDSLPPLPWKWSRTRPFYKVSMVQ